MALQAGAKLGPYQIVAAAGAGGMGEVYRARDTRLDRTVAIKVLPEQFSQNPDLKQRFEREARAISSLNHPNICHLYDVGHQDGTDYLVMEFIEGESLASRLSRGPLPLEQTLKTGIEIADALDKAHRQGIVHRDLKPGNVMLTKSGAKLLDFGLAKPAGVMRAASSSNQVAVTATSPPTPITQQGHIVGTFQYMAPEQVEGKEADARSDIFALGTVLYEMATGKRAFEGKSAISIASAILEKDPEPISAVQPLTPPALDHVVGRALIKDPEQRWQSAADLSAELRWISSTGTQTPKTAAERFSGKVWTAAIAVAMLVAGAGLAWFIETRGAAPPILIQSYLPAPEKAHFIVLEDDQAGPVVISADGRQIAFVALGADQTRQIWVRTLNGSEAKPVPGTERGSYPFWSPDGKWLGFFSDGKLRKVPVGGGAVLALAAAENGRGGSWSDNGQILYAPVPQSPIYEVSASGGTPQQMTKLARMHTTNRWPLWLPGGKRFLYLATSHGAPDASDTNGIYLASTDGKENRILLPSASSAVYASGYLLYPEQGTLMARRFDADRGILTGDPVPVAQGVQWNRGTWRGAFDASQNGILVYHSGESSRVTQLLWASPGSEEKIQPVGLPPDPFGTIRLSPDGHKLVVGIGDPLATLWLYDITRGTKTRLTFSGSTSADTPMAWSPDGSRVAYAFTQTSNANGDSFYIKEVQGTAPAEEVLKSPGPVGYRFITDWSPDGKYLLYRNAQNANMPALWLLPLTGDRTPRPYLQPNGSYAVYEGRFSPNGKWVAYESDETGPSEIYVTGFPDPKGKWQVSADGGFEPHWSHDGKYVLYRRGNEVLQVPITERGAELEAGTPRSYLKTAHVFAGLRWGASWDIAPDGKIILNANLSERESQSLTLLVNWTAALNK